MRQRLRKRLLEEFARLLRTEEIRELQSELLSSESGHTRSAVGQNSPVPYEDVASTGRVASNRTRDDTVFITGRFRSGSTALWSVFRKIKSCRAYYEPFNERRFFDSRHRGDHVDSSHLGVKDYWQEYGDMEHLGQYYDENWVRHGLYMNANSWNPAMRAYIDALIDGGSKRAILQFNRVDFRLDWLLANFPQATIVHLYRHPRDQWCSTLSTAGNSPPYASMHEFKDYFYLQTWARDLQSNFPFLRFRESDHPYRIFYLIWKLSWLFGTTRAHISVAFEDLVADPEREIGLLLDSLGIDEVSVSDLATSINSVPIGRWRSYASADWFEAQEVECESILSDWFRTT